MKRIRKALSVTLFLIAILYCSGAFCTGFQTDYQAIDNAAQSMFLVEVLDQRGEVVKTGSGFVAFDSHCFITNHHVIEDASALMIHSDQHAATHKLTNLIAYDEYYDIAILEFPEGSNYRSLPLDPEYQLLRGQPITAIGSPKGILNTVSNGNISTFHYYRDGTFDIQFTAPISHGSSGGALFNEEGNVIGLVYATITDGESLNLAVPIQYVIDLYNQSSKTTQSLSDYNHISNTPTPTKTSPRKTPVPKLFAPASIVISLNSNGFPTLSWVAVPGATNYKIYREKASGQHELIGTIDVSSSDTKLLFTDERPKWGKENTYYIASSNASTYAQKSRAISIQVPIQSITKEISVSTPNPVPAVPKGIDKNYQTTEIPLLTPTPIPVLPEGIEKSYNVGAKGEDILAIKKRLKELGYYSKGSSLVSTYNDTMVERVKLFQIDNKLEATGILDYSTLLLLFSKDVSSSAKGNNSPTSSPINKAPIIDSAFSLTIPSGSICESHIDNAGNLKCRFQIRNTAQKKTAVEFEIYVYTKNASGVPLLGEGKFISVTTKKKVKPGETVFTDYVSIPNGDSVARIYVAISKIKYSDGNIVSYPSMYPKYVSWSFN